MSPYSIRKNEDGAFEDRACKACECGKFRRMSAGATLREAYEAVCRDRVSLCEQKAALLAAARAITHGAVGAVHGYYFKIQPEEFHALRRAVEECEK